MQFPPLNAPAWENGMGQKECSTPHSGMQSTEKKVGGVFNNTVEKPKTESQTGK